MRNHFLKSPSIILFLILIITTLLYTPGLQGDFIFDDFPNIASNDNVKMESLDFASLKNVSLSGIATDLSRPISMLSFGLNYYFVGNDPFYFKVTNLLIHLLCTIGIFLLSKKILSLPAAISIHINSTHIALIIATCWALLPINVSSVVYVVQRMNQLSALTVIIALLYYLHFRTKETCNTLNGIFALFTISALIGIGVLCKENAALIALFILISEFFLFDFKANSQGHKVFLKLFLTIFIALPTIGVVGIFIFSPESIIGNYSIRTYTPYERVLTESRAIWLYIQWIIFPNTNDLVFYHDNLLISRSLLNPISTFFSILGIILLITISILGRKKLPILCFGIAFFLAGHALESTIINLELLFEHRNYLPSFGILLALIHLLFHLPEGIMRLATGASLAGLYIIFLAHGTWVESNKWSNTFTHLVYLSNTNPGSHRINYTLGQYFLNLASINDNDEDILAAASDYMHRAIPLDPKATRAHTGVILSESQYLMKTDESVISDLVFRLSTIKLSPNNTQDVSLLTDCLYSGSCNFDKEIIARIYTAIASNQNTDLIVRQGILEQIGSALAFVFNKPEDAKAIFYLARSLRNELTIIDISLIQIEMKQGNIESARMIANEANKKKGTTDIKAAIEELRTELEKL